MPITKLTPTAFEDNVKFRNLIINGDMSIAQRGTSSTGITSSGYKTVDRFLVDIFNMGTFTMSQDTDVPTGQGFVKSTKLDCTTADASPSANDFLILRQKFEGQNLQYLKKGTSNAESLTLSFWVKSNKTGTYIAELKDQDNTRNISKSYTINSADTWEKKTITYEADTTGTLDNDNAASLQLFFWLGAGSNYTSGTLQTSWGSQVTANRVVGQVNLADSTDNEWYITGVQLEAGEVASDFEFLPVDVNLQRCQRYYTKSYALDEAPGTNTWTGTIIGRNYDTTSRASNTLAYSFPVTMRATPTFTAYSRAGTSGKAVTGSTTLNAGSTEVNCTFNKPNIHGIQAANVTVSGTHFFQVHFEASAEL